MYQSLHWHQETRNFSGGGYCKWIFHGFAVKLALHQLPRCFKRLSPLLAAPAALLLSQGPAQAVLNVNIFDDGPNLKVTVDGSISQVGTPLDTAGCVTGALIGQFSVYGSILCTGTGGLTANSPVFAVSSGSTGFGGNGVLGLPSGADRVEGFQFVLAASSWYDPRYQNTIFIDSSYSLGQPFSSSATFNGTSLALQGFAATGLVGTWSIVGTSESINVYIGTTATPGPLPLFGAAAAFGWSRRLRKRIAAPLSTPPQA